MNLAKNIKAVAKVHGKSISGIAEELGEKYLNNFSRKINNERITLQDLEDIANVIGCNIMDFFAGARESKSEISGFLKANGKIIEVRTIEDLQNIINNARAREH